MLRQKREKSGTGICHVMQGKESKPVPVILATGKDVSGEERSLLIFNYVTPNKLFQDTKKIENTKVLKDPEGKEENSFVPF